MSSVGRGDDDLRNLFADPAGGVGGSDACPVPDAILQAVRGELPGRKARELADHAAICPACATAWRLARDPEFAPRARHVPRARMLLRAAAAAVVLVGAVLAGILWVGQDRGPAQPGYRQLSREGIRSLIGEGPLPSDAFVLRWAADVECTRYDVRVTDRRLTILAEARGLTVPEYAVPEDDLAGLVSGDPVLWQVDGYRTDGRKLTSETFVVPLE